MVQIILTEEPEKKGRIGKPLIDGPTRLQSKRNDFTIATYNILNLPGTETIEEAKPRTLKLAGHIKDMGSPDVVALQEVQVRFSAQVLN